MDDKMLLELWRRYKWTLLLAVVGLVFAVCVISYGFFKALFILICIVVGVFCGRMLDKRIANKQLPKDPFSHE